MRGGPVGQRDADGGEQPDEVDEGGGAEQRGVAASAGGDGEAEEGGGGQAYDEVMAETVGPRTGPEGGSNEFQPVGQGAEDKGARAESEAGGTETGAIHAVSARAPGRRRVWFCRGRGGRRGRCRE